jgi:two-component system sensor histidine kinase KdpD
MDAVRSWVGRHGYSFAILCIAVATLLFYPGRDYFAKGQWALLYLPVIVLVASTNGVRPALVAAVLAFLTWNFFFLPPYHTLFVTDLKDWLSLFVFLLVGIAMGLQTGRMKWRESEALAEEREATLLNRFSSHLVTEMNTAGMTEMLLGEIALAMGAETAALYLSDDAGEFSCAGRSPALAADSDEAIDRLASWVYEHAQAIGLPSDKSISDRGLGAWPISVRHDVISPGSTRKDVLLPLQTASRVEGVLYVGAKMNGADYNLHDARLLVSIVNQAAAFRERRRLQHVAGQAEVLHEADRLKSAFISSISHELKTPLTSVTATITSLLEEDVEWDPVVIREELKAIGDDLDRLNDSIISLLDLSRLESKAWSPQRDWYEIGEIIGSAVSRIPQKRRERISFSIPDGLPPIYVDFPQWARALQNLLENALAYSDPGQPVCVGAASDSQEIRIWVEDRGPGINPEEKVRVFDKFYRGAASEKVPSGTGLGLAITKEIVSSHGGDIFVEDTEPQGARFVISLPNKIVGEDQ